MALRNVENSAPIEAFRNELNKAYAVRDNAQDALNEALNNDISYTFDERKALSIEFINACAAVDALRCAIRFLATSN